MKKAMLILFSLVLLNCVPAYSMTFDEKEEYCDEVVNWEYDDICTHEVYCESIYWEDENCIYFELGNLKVDADFCKTIIWNSTKEACFKAIEDDKKLMQKRKNTDKYDLPMTFDEKADYCDEVVNWEYDDICTHEIFCESIYWEDKDNCTYFEPGNLKVDIDFCETIIWDSTKAACFKAIEDDKKLNKG